MSTKISLLCLLLLFTICFPICADAAPWAGDFQQLRRDYQVLAKDYQAVLSEIYGNQAEYGKLNWRVLTDLVKDFLGDLKNDAPYEKLPDDPIALAKRYADYASNLSDELKIFLTNADLQDRLTELDLRAQNLSFRGTALERMGNQLPSDTRLPPPPPLLTPPTAPRVSSPRDDSSLDDAVLVSRWLDLGNRAFSNKAEEGAFYQRHPEYLKYRKIADLRSPADDIARDSTDLGAAALERAVRDIALAQKEAEAFTACTNACPWDSTGAACVARCTAACKSCR